MSESEFEMCAVWLTVPTCYAYGKTLKEQQPKMSVYCVQGCVHGSTNKKKKKKRRNLPLMYSFD